MVSDTFFARSRGAIIQLAGLAEGPATSSSGSSADARGSKSCVMAYPTQLLLQGDQGAHNMCLVDAETKAKIDVALRPHAERNRQVVAYGVGGQYDESQRNCRRGLHIYSLEAPDESSVYSFKQRSFLIDGHHKGCIELRPKLQGIGEFDGQSALIYFKAQWFLYARANCATKGHRQVQVCVGEKLSSLGEFKYVSFAGVPLCADVYFAHVYRTQHDTLAAVLPMAEPPVADQPTQGGIYIAESSDGYNYGPPVLLRRSSVYLRRTADIPMHYPSIALMKGTSFELPLHLCVKSRMPTDAPCRERFAWCTFSLASSLAGVDISGMSICRRRT